MKATWQYFDMENVMREALDKDVCRYARLSRLIMELGVIFCARSEGAVGAWTTRCYCAGRAFAAASSSSNTCRNRSQHIIFALLSLNNFVLP